MPSHLTHSSAVWAPLKLPKLLTTTLTCLKTDFRKAPAKPPVPLANHSRWQRKTRTLPSEPEWASLREISLWPTIASEISLKLGDSGMEGKVLVFGCQLLRFAWSVGGSQESSRSWSSGRSRVWSGVSGVSREPIRPRNE